jgi:hypothetical protein
LTNDELRASLEQWFATGDETVLDRIIEQLSACMVASRAVLSVVGEADVDQIRQELLARLLDRGRARLRDRDHPLAYARTAWKHSLTDAIDQWAPRMRAIPAIVQHALDTAPSSAGPDHRLDAERAIAIAASLEGKGRLAILLTTRPDRISEQEWAEVVSHLPPPPPPRPDLPLDRDEAAAILFPPKPGSPPDERQQLNSFDKAFKRAAARIRHALEGE